VPALLLFVAGRIVAVAGSVGVAVSVSVAVAVGVAELDGVAVPVAVALASAVSVSKPASATRGDSPLPVRKKTPPAAMPMPIKPSSVQPRACRAGVEKKAVIAPMSLKGKRAAQSSP
jgi:hypothetical protein